MPRAERGKAEVRTARSIEPRPRSSGWWQGVVETHRYASRRSPWERTGQWAAGGEKDSAESDFHRRGLETLDHVLTQAGVTSFDARRGRLRPRITSPSAMSPR